MPLIKWDENFSVGVKIIDKQHQRMIAILNRVYGMVESASNNIEEINQILKEMTDYADFHFSTEEEYFLEFDYDKTAMHTQLHNDYRERVAEFKKRFAAELSNDILIDLSEFLDGWWIWHIKNTDKEYTQCFHDHGLF
ncbi:MAG TPA: bacteriohemerythrin [Candidatus Methylomirabilis sp.]|nr:bacteriohemerythrin [Candidatus Methylomirabilis sp.]